MVKGINRRQEVFKQRAGKAFKAFDILLARKPGRRIHELDEPKFAGPHYEKAIEFAFQKNRIDGLNKKLVEARKEAAK